MSATVAQDALGWYLRETGEELAPRGLEQCFRYHDRSSLAASISGVTMPGSNCTRILKPDMARGCES
jgi:hypothetical protein